MKRRPTKNRSRWGFSSEGIGRAIKVSMALVGLLWVVEIVDLSSGFQLDGYGILHRKVDGLMGIFWSPLLHADFAHLIANSGPLVLLLIMLFSHGQYRPKSSLAFIWLVSGLGTWLIGRPAIHIGASSIVYGLAAFQINILLTNAIAFSHGDHIVASFNYATRLMELPQGVFGVSLATFILPMLSGLAAEKKYGAFQAGLRQGMQYLIFANWIATTLTMVLAEPIVRLLFEGERFDSSATQRAALALQCLIPGLVSFSLVNILARAFFALGEVTLTMRISVLSLTCNLVFAFFLIPTFKQAGMGLSNALSSLVNLGFLWYAMRRKFPNMQVKEMIRPTFWIMGAGIFAALIAWMASRSCDTYLSLESKFHQTLMVFIPLCLGLATYGGLTYVLKIEACLDILKLFRQKLDKTGSKV